MEYWHAFGLVKSCVYGSCTWFVSVMHLCACVLVISLCIYSGVHHFIPVVSTY